MYEGKFIALVQASKQGISTAGEELEKLYGKGFRIVEVTTEGLVILENEYRLEVDDGEDKDSDD